MVNALHALVLKRCPKRIKGKTIRTKQCRLLAPGDQLPTDNPCESCFCDEMSGVMCAVMACVPCTPPMHHVPVAGSCCGECRDVSVQPVLGCEVNGSHYNVGLYHQNISTIFKTVPDKMLLRYKKSFPRLFLFFDCSLSLLPAAE